MVSSIVPGAQGAGALGVDTRSTRASGSPEPKPEVANARGDSVEVGDAASWAAVRESVRAGLAFVRETLALARDAQTMLSQVQTLAEKGGAQADLDALLNAYAERSEAVSAETAGLGVGAEISVIAEPGAPPVRLAGLDLQLRDAPGGGDLLLVGRGASIDDPGLAGAAQRSLDLLESAMERLANATRSLEAHQSFLGAAEGALAANPNLDADGARLLALQVRQGLANAGAIANVQPQAVLALFRA